MAETPFMELYRESEGVPLVGADGQPQYDMTGPKDYEAYVLTKEQVAEELGTYLVEGCVECTPSALEYAKAKLIYWIGVGRMDYRRAATAALARTCGHPRPPFEFAVPDPSECGVVELYPGQVGGTPIL